MTLGELAKMLDKIYHDYDPYQYADCGMNEDVAVGLILNRSIETIQTLCGIIESLNRERRINNE